MIDLKFIYLLLSFTLLFGTACKKDKNDSSTPSSVSKTCYITKEVSDDGSYFYYTYNTNNQVTNYVSFDPTTSTTSSSVYTYSANKVIMNQTDGAATLVQTIFLNSKGFADSTLAINPGVYNLKLVYTYTSAGVLVKQVISGTLLGSPFNQTYTYEYANGNYTKETSNDGTTISTTTYEYYSDVLNARATTDIAISFIPASKNAVKKTTWSDGSYRAYTYEYDSENKPVKFNSVDNTSKTIKTVLTWSCK